MYERSKFLGLLFVTVFLIFTAAAICEDLPASAPSPQLNTPAGGDPLLQLLVTKGVLNADEAKSLSGTPGEQRAKLLALLRQ